MFRVDWTETFQYVAPLALSCRTGSAHDHIASGDNGLLVCDRHCDARIQGSNGSGEADHASGCNQCDVGRGIKDHRAKVLRATANDAARLRVRRSERIMLRTATA